MPVLLSTDGASVGPALPSKWLPAVPGDGSRDECVRIALVNNMPDAALEDTEAQFFGLLRAAAVDLTVHVQLYSLPEIARDNRAKQHMSGSYGDLRDLPNGRFDALIVTGTEPREQDLRREAYWNTLAEVFDWAEDNTVSTILSCLAAHASALHGDGIARHRLSDKRFGVFDESRACDHPLVRKTSRFLRIPHSRWNELRETDLRSRGYTIITKSEEAGVGLFVKHKGKSLFVHWQGHPEYAAHTLLKEYRRDVKRFIRRERETYPSLPHGYFGIRAGELLAEFRKQVLSDPREEMLALFPTTVVAETVQNGWHSAGAHIYRNWLEYVISRKTNCASRSFTRAARAQL